MDVSAIPEARLHRCISVGFVVSQNEDAKILVPTVADVEHVENRHCYGGMLIPRSAIRRERRIA